MIIFGDFLEKILSIQGFNQQRKVVQIAEKEGKNGNERPKPKSECLEAQEALD